MSTGVVNNKSFFILLRQKDWTIFCQHFHFLWKKPVLTQKHINWWHNDAESAIAESNFILVSAGFLQNIQMCTER